MKVGTDAILLGAWAFGDVSVDSTRNVKSILDVGTGSGIVALMMAQRFPKAVVQALEIDEAAAQQAAENFRSSPWPNRLRVDQANFNQWIETHSLRRFELIVSNPPYFENSLRPPQAERRAARHADLLTVSQLMTGAAERLEPHGSLCVIFPASGRQTCIDRAAAAGLLLQEECRVRPTPQHDVHRVLLRFGLHAETDPAVRELAIEHQRHQYTEDYAALAGDFLLKL